MESSIGTLVESMRHAGIDCRNLTPAIHFCELRDSNGHWDVNTSFKQWGGDYQKVGYNLLEHPLSFMWLKHQVFSLILEIRFSSWYAADLRNTYGLSKLANLWLVSDCAEFILCYIGTTGATTPEHQAIKKFGDKDFGVATQCVSVAKLMKGNLNSRN